MARDLPQDSLRAAQALNTANNIVNTFIPGNDESIERCLQIASHFLSAKNGDSQHEVVALGHCHIGKSGLYGWVDLGCGNACILIISIARYWMALAF